MLKTVGNPSTRSGDQTILAGNLVIGTAGKGIDFSADASTAGMTSELLDDYEEGTWTPVANGYDGVLTINRATYIKIGSLVMLNASVTFDGTTDSSVVTFVGLPFNAAASSSAFGAFVNFDSTGQAIRGYFSSSTAIRMVTALNATITFTSMGTGTLSFTAVYNAV